MTEALPPATAVASANDLDDRYGTRRGRRFDRRFAWAAALAMVLGGVAFLLWSGWQEGGRVEIQDIGFTSTGDSSGSVKFMVSGPAETPLACAVEALSTSKATVGWKVILVPASSDRSHTITTRVLTTSPATAGYVKECWVVETGEADKDA